MASAIVLEWKGLPFGGDSFGSRDEDAAHGQTECGTKADELEWARPDELRRGIWWLNDSHRHCHLAIGAGFIRELQLAKLFGGQVMDGLDAFDFRPALLFLKQTRV